MSAFAGELEEEEKKKRAAVDRAKEGSPFGARRSATKVFAEGVPEEDEDEEDVPNFYVLALEWIKPGIVALGGTTGEVVLWKLDWESRYPGARVVRVMKEHEDCVRSLVLSPDGTHLASASDDKTASGRSGASPEKKGAPRRTRCRS